MPADDLMFNQLDGDQRQEQGGRPQPLTFVLLYVSVVVVVLLLWWIIERVWL